MERPLAKSVVNLSQFVQELLILKKEAIANLSKKDYFELKKIITTNRILLFVGFATIWIAINPFSMILISIAMHSQWTAVAHHVMHGAYDKIPGINQRYHTKFFAMGWRRWIDWFDWVYPIAWKYEHNVLHHFYTNELIDPDMMFYRVNYMFKRSYPTYIKCIFIWLVACLWKPIYYSNNTLKALNEKKSFSHSTDYSGYLLKSTFINFIPYIGCHFVLLPLLFTPLSFVTSISGFSIFIFVLINRIGAEILTNLHAFCTILPSHTHPDLALQPKHFTTKEEFFLHQIKSTCNYQSGGFISNYLYGYMNYQIEHHLFPDLPPTQYIKLQPKIKALCHQYGITYHQKNIFSCVKKAVDILIGKEIMTESGLHSTNIIMQNNHITDQI